MTQNFMKGGLLAALLVLPAVGCTDKDTGGESGDSVEDTCPGGFYDGPYQIAEIDVSCTDGTPDSWNYYAKTDGYAGTMDVAVFETGDGNWPGNPSAVWDEEHDLTNTDFDADCGTYDEWQADFTDVATPGEVGATTTLFDCTYATGIGGADGSIAIKFTMYDDASAAIDCAIAGYESEDYWNDNQGDDCVCFDTDADCTN